MFVFYVVSHKFRYKGEGNEVAERGNVRTVLCGV